jgi:hypothetical protein
MSDFRDKLGHDLDAEYDLVRDFLKDAVKATRKVWHSCPDCKKRSEVEIPDIKAGLHAAQLWIEQGKGKTAQAKAVDQQPIDLDVDVNSMTAEQMARVKAQVISRLGQASPELRSTTG